MTMTRNVNCPYYKTCLDRTISVKANAWSCDDCPWVHSEIGPPDVLELMRFYLLAIAVVHPKVYHKYLGDRKTVIPNHWRKPCKMEVPRGWMDTELPGDWR